MKILGHYNDAYFNRFPETPVVIKPFDPHAVTIAQQYGSALNAFLAPWKIQAVHMGSTALGISGKGEVEFGIFIPATHWFPVIVPLINHYKGIASLTADTAHFNDSFLGYPIEIKPALDTHAKVNLGIMHYLQTHPETLREYEGLKYTYAYSKREYYREKFKFYEQLIKKI
jgi:GrpB-like predicted nucleotidyltransferase (UPF0157 family)